MSDTTVTTSTPDNMAYGYNHGHSDHGRAADHAAYNSMANAKDVLSDLSVINNRQGDSFAAVQQSIADTKATIGDRVDGSAFRTLEQFGILGVQGQKLSAASDVLVQKTTGEIVTQVTLTAKDGIIDAAKNAAAAALQAEKIASASVLEATKNTYQTAIAISEAAEETQEAIAQAAKEAAACCCATKALIIAEAGATRLAIRDDGDKTRELVNLIERTRQSVELMDTKTELSNAKQTEVLRGVLANLSIGTGK